MDQQTLKQRAGGLMAAAAALVLAAAPAAASAQTTVSTSSTPTSRSAQISTTVTVQSVDVASRHITVKLPSGETEVLKAPAEFKRLGDLKPGDNIKATYYAEVAFAISQPGKPLPEDTDTVFTARAAKGEAPAGLVANHRVVTGAILKIDVPGSKVKVVNVNGGEVHDLDVATPEGKALLAKLKVGDKVTAYISEALLISVDRG
jgi:Cu/Ag efflux protein CusF